MRIFISSVVKALDNFLAYAAQLTVVPDGMSMFDRSMTTEELVVDALDPVKRYLLPVAR